MSWNLFLKPTSVVIVYLLSGCSTGASKFWSSEHGSLYKPPEFTPLGEERFLRFDLNLRQLNGNDRPALIVRFDSNGELTSEDISVQIQTIARKLREDDQIAIRLSAKVRQGGSPAWNLGAAEKALKSLRERLIYFRIPTRKIKIVPFSNEYKVAQNEADGVAEIHLIKTR